MNFRRASITRSEKWRMFIHSSNFQICLVCLNDRAVAREGIFESATRTLACALSSFAIENL